MSPQFPNVASLLYNGRKGLRSKQLPSQALKKIEIEL